MRAGIANIKSDCDIMIDPIRVVDNKGLVNKIGDLPGDLIEWVKENTLIILDLIYSTKA